MNNNILVFVEQREGKILPASFQLLACATHMAGKTGGQAEACLVGEGVDGLVADIAAYGAKKVYKADGADFKHYRPTPYTAAVAVAIDAADPRTVLFPTSSMGRDLSARLGARRRASMLVDCIEIDVDGADLLASKTMYAGKVTAKFKLSGQRLQVATIRSNAYAADESQAGASADVQDLSVSLDESDQRLKVNEVRATTSGIKDVTEADIIVSGGRSVKSEENFEKVIYPLAEQLDAAVGASRAACDAGYQPHSRQVGLTGKTVTPALYIACGIDGAIQHLAGMRGSKVIVAINTKKEAPIYTVATYGCVMDLFEVVPALTEELIKAKG